MSEVYKYLSIEGIKSNSRYNQNVWEKSYFKNERFSYSRLKNNPLVLEYVMRKKKNTSSEAYLRKVLLVASWTDSN